MKSSGDSAKKFKRSGGNGVDHPQKISTLAYIKGNNFEYIKKTFGGKKQINKSNSRRI